MAQDVGNLQPKVRFSERFFRPLAEVLHIEFDKGSPQIAPAPLYGYNLDYGPMPQRIPLFWRPAVTNLGGAVNNPVSSWSGIMLPGGTLVVRELRIPKITPLRTVGLRDDRAVSDDLTRIPATFIGAGPRDQLGR